MAKTDDFLAAKKAFDDYRDAKRPTVESDIKAAVNAAVRKVAVDHGLVVASCRVVCALSQFRPVGTVAAAGGGAPPGTPDEFTSDMERPEGVASAVYDVSLSELKFKES